WYGLNSDMVAGTNRAGPRFGLKQDGSAAAAWSTIGRQDDSAHPPAEPARAAMSGFQVQQIDHVSVLITDVERSRRFYRDLLGLKEIPKPRTFDFVVLWFDLGGQQLHLLLKDRPDPRGPRHFALRVADVAAAREYATQRGLRPEETTPIPGA